MELQPHQLKAVEELDNGKILYGDVGSGKSITAAAYYISKEAPRPIYVITTAKKRDSLDWDKEFAHFGVTRHADATVAGVLTVDSWNNIGKYIDVTDAFFIFDEQRLVGSGAWTKSFLKLAKSNRWILLTATPGDTWLDYIPVFVANGFYKNRTEFKQEHVIYKPFSKFPKVDRYVSVNRLVKNKNAILVHMPFQRHTIRHYKRVAVEYAQDLYKEATVHRWNPYTEKPIRNTAELFYVMRKVVNSDESRVGAVVALLEKHPRLIVFYNFDYELDILRETFATALKKRMLEQLDESLQPSSAEKSSSDFLDSELQTGNGTGSKNTVVAEWNGHRHDPIPETESWIYLVQYVAGSEGWNCTTTDSMVLYSLTYSYKNYHQALGRIDRMNTPFTDLNYYTLLSRAPIDQAIWGALRLKKNFNESKYVNHI